MDSSLVQQAFLRQTFWMVKKSPSLCRRDQFGHWLLTQFSIASDNILILHTKKQAVKSLIDFLEINRNDRIAFEKLLCEYIAGYNQCLWKRNWKRENTIRNSTSWTKTIENSIFTNGKFVCFDN